MARPWENESGIDEHDEAVMRHVMERVKADDEEMIRLVREHMLEPLLDKVAAALKARASLAEELRDALAPAKFFPKGPVGLFLWLNAVEEAAHVAAAEALISRGKDAN